MDFFLHLLYFPLWWYTSGARHVGRGLWGWIRTVNEYLAPGIWIRHLFVPMFGQQDIQGRLVSFFLRSVNSIFRSFALCVWMVIVCCLYVGWFLFPIVITIMLATTIMQIATPHSPLP